MQSEPLSEEGGFLQLKTDSNIAKEEKYFHKINIEKIIFMCYSISIEGKGEGKKRAARFWRLRKAGGGNK